MIRIKTEIRGENSIILNKVYELNTEWWKHKYKSQVKKKQTSWIGSLKAPPDEVIQPAIVHCCT
jgi:hypothetical protein